MPIQARWRPGFVVIRFALVIAAGILIGWLANGNPGFAVAQASAPTALPPMPANADPAFEVATIKPSDKSSPHGRFFTTRGRHAIAYNMSVSDLIAYAYGPHAKQIVGGPLLLLSTHFDIDGLPDVEGHPNLRQSRLLYQKLLVSRFKLTFHREARKIPSYAIVVAKDGPKLTRTTRKAGDSTVFSYTNDIVLTVRNASMTDFAHGCRKASWTSPWSIKPACMTDMIST